jgi:salicylate hydroxylase
LHYLPSTTFVPIHQHSAVVKTSTMAIETSSKKPFTVAIVGGGIGGLALAIGLRHHGISVQIYEACHAFAEIGAGIAFGPNAISAMALIDPAIRDAFRRLATKNGFEEEEETWINFRSGFGEPAMIAKVQTCDREKTGLSSVHRARFLDELAALIPKDIAHFGKRLLSFKSEESGMMTLVFEDGETATADALVGADGVRSRVRQLLLGNESVLDGLSFTGKYAYRGLISMDEAREAIGDDLAMNSQMYLGKDGHVLTYPIDHGETMNVVAFKNKEDGLWEHDHWVLKKKGNDMRREFAQWGKPVRAVLEVSDNMSTTYAC